MTAETDLAGANAAAGMRAVDAPKTRSTGQALTRAASGSFALNVTNTVFMVLTTALLARVMTVTDFGIYSWAVATATLLTVPAVLGVDRLLVRDVAVYMSRQALARVRGLVRWTSAIVVATSVALLAGGMLVALATRGPGDETRFWALAIALVVLPLLAAARVVQSALMGAHDVVVGQLPELLLRPAAFVALVVVALLALGSGAQLPAEVAVALYGGAVLVGLLAGVVLLARRLMTRLPRTGAEYQGRAWMAAAIALALLSGAAIVNGQIGVVLLGVLDTPDRAGLYAVAQRGAQLIAFPLLAVNAALAPTAARLWAGRSVAELQHLVTRSSRGILLASVPAALVFIVFGSTILEVAFGGPFAAAGTVLAILSVGQLANAATGSVATLLIMSGNQWRAGLGIVAGMLVNVALTVLLIPSLHAEGAAIAAATSLIVSNGIHVVVCRRTLGIDSTAIGLRAATARARAGVTES